MEIVAYLIFNFFQSEMQCYNASVPQYGINKKTRANTSNRQTVEWGYFHFFSNVNCVFEV